MSNSGDADILSSPELAAAIRQKKNELQAKAAANELSQDEVAKALRVFQSELVARYRNQGSE